jgi:aspartate kinase
MKFGGSLLAGKEGVSRVALIVKRCSQENEVVVIVSAMGDVTDLLLEASGAALAGDEEGARDYVGRVREVQLQAISQLNPERGAKAKLATDELILGLSRALQGVSLLKELTPRSRDLIVSFGERLSTPLVAAAMEEAGLHAKALTGAEAGIVTDDSFGEASPDFAATRRGLRRTLSPLVSRGIVPVVSGFIAATPGGETTTLGRGGSDYTATIVADALGADEVWIWTDVGGIMTADPRIVPRASVVKELSYAEAEEMAFFGAKNMHPLALGPAKLAKIPVRIKNGRRPELPGTLIHTIERKKVGVAKAILLVRNVGMLTVSGEMLMGKPGTAGEIFRALGEKWINIVMISQSVSESNISMIVRRESLHKARLALESGRSPLGKGLSVGTESDVAVIAAVGAGMKGTPGVAARVFGAVASAGINVRMIAQGSSELNISFVVREKDAVKAVEVLHADLVAGA